MVCVASRCSELEWVARCCKVGERTVLALLPCANPSAHAACTSWCDCWSVNAVGPLLADSAPVTLVEPKVGFDQCQSRAAAPAAATLTPVGLSTCTHCELDSHMSIEIEDSRRSWYPTADTLLSVSLRAVSSYPRTRDPIDQTLDGFRGGKNGRAREPTSNVA